MHGAKGRHTITPDSHKCYHCSALLRRAALSNNALLVLLRRCDDAQLALGQGGGAVRGSAPALALAAGITHRG